MKKFPFPVRYMIPVVLALIGCVTGAYAYKTEIARSDIEVESNIADAARSQGTTAVSMMEYMLRMGDIDGADLFISQMGTDPDLRSVDVTDGKGSILFSTNYLHKGRMLKDVLSIPDFEIVRESQKVVGGVVRLSEDHATLYAVYPFFVAGEKTDFRPSDLGVVFFDYDVSYSRNMHYFNARENTLNFVMSYAFFSLVLWFYFHRTITTRVARLAKTTEEIGRGRLSVRSELHGSDEFALLSDSINEMAQGLSLRDEKLQEHKDRLETIFNSLDSIVYVADMDTHEILFINKYVRDRWGDITGKKCWETLQKGQSGSCPFCSNDKLLNENGAPIGAYVWEFQNTTDNEWYECRDQAIWWMDGRLVRLEIATNITERKKVSQMRDSLIRDVSHSLKNPISIAKMAVDGYIKAVKGSDIENIEQFGSIMKSNVETAYNDITRVLDSYILEEGQTGIRRVKMSLRKMVDELYSGKRSFIEKKALSFHADIPEHLDIIVADEREIRMLLDNVIDNSIKFTDKGGILLSAKESGGMVEIEIKDTGSGVDPAIIWRVFDKFFQRHASVDGVGIGLTICKEIVKRHSGTIEFLSDGVGLGTTVRIKLPRGNI